MASFITSAAVPWIGMFKASRSPEAWSFFWEEASFKISRRRWKSVST